MAFFPTDRRFTGQRWESSLGLYDYRARFYDPTLGRCLQPDPLVPEPGNPQGLNRYAYVYSNPLRYTDPTGHCPWCIALAIGIVFVGALVYPDIAYAPDLSADLSRLPPSESHAFERFVAANLPGIDTANDLATLTLGRDPLLREEVPYGSREWWLTGVAVLGVGLSGGAGRKAGKAAEEADRFIRHHIATNKNWIRDPQWSKLFQELFAQAGMTLEEAANIVELPASLHKGPHSQAYHQWVYDELSRAIQGLRKKEEIRAALEARLRWIAEQLQAHPEYLRNPPIPGGQ